MFFLAGQAGSAGNTDGSNGFGRFNFLYGTAVDTAGNVYVADYNNSLIRKVTPAGAVSTFAGLAGTIGSTDGTGSAARFNYPQGVAVDTAGNVYVADAGNCTIRKITSAGVVSTLAGTVGVGGSADGTGSAASFNSPAALTVDTSGNIYVADSANSIIRKVTSAGVVTTLAGNAAASGSADGTGAAASFYYPYGITVDGSGNVFVADYGNSTIRKITSGGVVTTFAGAAGVTGSTDATGTSARFKNPFGITIDSSGNLFVVDEGNITIRKITSAGVVTTLAGALGSAGYVDATGTAAKFNNPSGLSVDSSGNLYVADINNSSVRKVTSAGVVTTLAGSVAVTGSTDGSGAIAKFSAPHGIALDSSGHVYVADSTNATIRKITGNTVTTFAGSAGAPGGTDATGTAARFRAPYGIAADTAGNLYVADTSNDTIRKITSAAVVTTFAGTVLVPGSTDATGTAASFKTPRGIAVDSSGNVYVADTANNTIRKITSAGVVTTLAGTAGVAGSTDATGAAASFKSPWGVAVDSAGNVYVADTSNATIRKITSAGVVTTLAGLAGSTGSTDGTGSAARFNQPLGVAVDSGGNVYVADSLNNAIRKVTPLGVVTTVVGGSGKVGASPGTLPSSLYQPAGLVVSGKFFFVTTANAVFYFNVP